MAGVSKGLSLVTKVRDPIKSPDNPVTLAHVLLLNHAFEGILIDGKQASKQAKAIDYLHGLMQTEHRDET